MITMSNNEIFNPGRDKSLYQSVLRSCLSSGTMATSWNSAIEIQRFLEIAYQKYNLTKS